ncbi:serine hydrolase domain-containing protein [Sphingomonas floccifaciens]|uniref:Serine hydrolase domain-containing protein n=1 Tax=Sphingomonas floccifaciens TaxID=1844115 RepID=A0ABW4N8S8_9SPHN
MPAIAAVGVIAMPAAAIAPISPMTRTVIQRHGDESARGDIKAQTARALAIIEHEMRDRRIPGLQVAVVKDGRIILQRGLGLSNVESHVPVSDKTLFAINSATKSFTGVAMMQLVEAGKVDLQAPISRYLDDLPASWRAIRIRQLLAHTSGLPNIVDRRGLIGGGSEAEAWAKITTLPLDAPTGTRFAYNQTNYALLARIIAKLSGMPFEQYYRQRQFIPAGMIQTTFGDTFDVVPNAATPYAFMRKVPGQAAVETKSLSRWAEDLPAGLRTGGGIQTIAQELAQWIIALQDGKLIKDRSRLAEMWAPEPLAGGGFGPWGAGWPAVRTACHPAYAGIGGARSAFYVYPDDGLAVIVLTNLVGAEPETFIDSIADVFVPGIASCAKP